MSPLDILPQSMRTQLTEERLACLRAIAELQAENATLRSEREKTEAALRKLVMALAESDDAADRGTIVAMVALGLWQRDPKEAHDQS